MLTKGYQAIQVICCAVLSAWPNSTPTIMTFYFLTFSTAAWGYALLAWFAEILRREPEARAIMVGLAFTLVYVGHATIPLRAWRVKDSPRYPIGFPLATAFAVFSILVMFAMKWYVDRNEDLVKFGFSRTEAVAEVNQKEGEEEEEDKVQAAVESVGDKV